MPTMEIDGQKVSFEGKKMILQVAQENGVEIPSYCYHPGLSIVASCRICLGEIESPDPKDPTKLVKVPKLVPTCQTPAADGMKVYTKSQKSRANQKAVMEFLLINHPLDCPVCDQAGECYLQDYSYKYGRAESRFIEDKSKNPKKDVGEHVLLYSDRCIMCTRCVRFTREISGTNELAVFGRGHREEIDIFQGKPLNNPLSANVVDICPVGALLDKDFLFTQRVWFLKSTPSVSPFTSGGENIYVHHNEGRIYRIKPRYNAEINKWWIADETRYGFQFVHATDRLKVPERLQFGSTTEVSWDAAYKHADEELKAAAKSGGVACIVSPFDTTEEIFLQVQYARSIDPNAWLVMNPVRVDGEDQVFKNPTTGKVTYTIKAEKAPNRKGVEKMFAHFGGNSCQLGELHEKIKSKKVTGALLSADPFPVTHVGDYRQLLTGMGTLVRLGTRGGAVYENATISMPTCTWAEKGGTYENFEGRMQPFGQAILPMEGSRSTGQIFWHLLGNKGTYSSAAVRERMSAAGLSDYATLTEPVTTAHVDDMQFAEL